MIHVIMGPPCSGKSTYVQEHRQTGDVVVDYDKLAEALGNDQKHHAEGAIKSVTFKAREAAIAECCEKGFEAWIIHTKPTEKQRELYAAAGAEYIMMDTDLETCLERCEADNRPEGTAEVIREYFKGREPMIKTKLYEAKAENGTISGYASTWIREPDSYGDIVAKGAFKESIEKIKAEGRVLPLLFNHDGGNLAAYIGTVHTLEEDDHGLKFEATFDDTPEAQRARELAATGRLVKFSFAYDVLDQGEVTLEDGRKANELRKLDIHEVSLVLYPANPDTSIVSVKAAEKSGRRNSAKDETELRRITELVSDIQTIVNGLLADDIAPDEDSSVKAEEPDTVNAEEQERVQTLLKEAEMLLKGEKR